MCSQKNVILALGIAGAHGCRDSTKMALQVAAKKDCHHLWPGRGGVPPVQISWDHCLSDTFLLFLSIGRSRSVESWRGSGNLFSFHLINVMDQLQRDNIITATWCAGAGFFTIYLRGGAAIEQLDASIQAAGFSFRMQEIILIPVLILLKKSE